MPAMYGSIGATRAALILATGILLIACDGVGTGQDVGVRNVLLITADDLGPHLASYGETLIDTPNFDRLAARSTQFDQAYVTQASCSSSRSSIFTGLYPHATGQYGLAGAGLSLHQPLRASTLPNLLKRAGFRTGIIGKLHVDPEGSFQFDQRIRGIDMRRVRDVADAAARFFVQGDRAQPFLLMVSYADPHALRHEHDRSQWHFPRQVDGLPEDPLPPGEDTIFDFQQTDSETQRIRTAGYYNAVQRLDAGIGLLLDALARSGHGQDTLVIFLGDHGPPFSRAKATTYEAGLRVPLLIHWPGEEQVPQSSAMVSAVDILPTIMDALDLAIPYGLHGGSLRQLVSDPQAARREYMFGEFHFHGSHQYFPRRSVRDKRYKLIHNLLAGERKPSTGIDGDQAHKIAQQPRYAGSEIERAFNTFADPPEFELYDLAADPIEFRNLAGQADMEEIESRLRQALMDWRAETADPFLEADYRRRYAEFADAQAKARRRAHR